MSGPESVLPPGASSGMSDILLRTCAAKYRSPCGMRREAAPIRGLPTHTPGPVLKHVLGLMQIWWLGKAEPLYGEAGAKAPASLTFLLD